MEIIASRRVRSIGGYAFAEVDKEVARLKEAGIQPTDFGVGDPTAPTPSLIRKACQAAVDARASAGYPSYVGSREFRAAVAAWMKRRFGVSLDPATQICSTIGAKEAVFHFAEAFVDPGDLVIAPSPGYPPYSRGTLFAEGRTYFYPLLAENGFLPDFSRIPAEVARAAKIFWLNYPQNPTGACAPPELFEEAVRFCQKHDILLASDEAYTEIYYGAPPRSILEFAESGVIAFQSFSKRSAMTCYRVGFVAGDPRAVEVFKKVKTNIDSGTPTFIQDAAVAALADEGHVREMREEYRQKRDILVEALTAAGLDRCAPDGTLYIWQRAPLGMTSVEFAKRLLAPEVALVTTPGAWVSDLCEGGLNPGEGYVRFALVPSLEETRAAADKIRKLHFG
jgi:LL-diaminopimelate aminotransferase